MNGTYEDVRQHTMIPEWKFYDTLHIADMARNVKGSVVECGTWRGGMVAGLYGALGTHREYILFDSFEGLPPAEEIDGPAAVAWQNDVRGPTYYDNCKANQNDVHEIMQKVGCHDYVVHVGKLEETLPIYAPRMGPIALLHIDVDWYKATDLCLRLLYLKVAERGVIIFDDYDAWDGCRKAVDDFIVNEKVQRYGGAYYHIKREYCLA